jgi:hypothetical protein
MANCAVMTSLHCTSLLFTILFDVETVLLLCMSQDSSVGIVTRLWAGQSRSRCSIYGRERDFSLLHDVQTGCGFRAASYTLSTGGCFLGSKVARV